MDRRRKLLIAFLLLMVGGFAADTAYRRWYEKPLADAEQKLASLDKELRDGKLDVRRQQNRLPLLDQLTQRSLPRNFEIAVTEYRSWLLQRIEESGLQQANLDSASPARFRDLYDRLDFSVRTRGTLSQVSEFLHSFYGTDYLHKIRSLSLMPTSDGTVDVSLTIETLILPTLAQIDQLPTPPVPSTRPALTDYYVVSQRNLFRQGDPPAASIKLSAITLDAEHRRQAWLSFLKTGETRILSEGDDFSLEGTHLQVKTIGSDTIQIAVDGQRREVRLGNTLDSPPSPSPTP